MAIAITHRSALGLWWRRARRSHPKANTKKYRAGSDTREEAGFFSKRPMPELIAPRQPPRCWPAMSCLDGVNVSEAIGCARRSRRPSRPATDTRLLVCCATSLQARLARQCKGERDVAKYRPETWKLCSPLTNCVCPYRLEAPSLPQDHSIRFAPAPFPFSYATSCRSSRWCRPASVRASAGADSALCVLQYVCLSS